MDEGGEALDPADTIRGVGLGLRWEFANELLERRPSSIDFLEIAPENYLRRGGSAKRTLERAGDAYPLLSHGLAMSLGGSDPLDERYLADLRSFFGEFATPWHSDHVCMTSDHGRVLHDLLPMPLTREAARHVADRVKRAQDRLGLPMAVENVSFYVHPGKRELSEPEFLRAICDEAKCGWLFDVNNAVVNAKNFGLDSSEWLTTAPLDAVVQFHVAGHEWFDFEGGELKNVSGALAPRTPGIDRLIVDTHGTDASSEVLSLLERALEKMEHAARVPVVIERDQNIPTMDELLAEVGRVRAVVDRALAARGRAAPNRGRDGAKASRL